MDSLEVLVWVFFFVAVVVSNLIQQRKRKARRKLEEAQAQAQAEAARTTGRATRPPTPRVEATPPRHAPSGAEPWGRAPDSLEAAEELLEAHARPPALELAVDTSVPQASDARADVPIGGPHPAARRPFRTAREVRHGIVAMTVLGPCRALEPYDEPTPSDPPRP